MDYIVNVRVILASFYIGTGGLDIGLVNSCQVISGGKSWGKTLRLTLQKCARLS